VCAHILDVHTGSPADAWSSSRPFISLDIYIYSVYMYVDMCVCPYSRRAYRLAGRRVELLEALHQLGEVAVALLEL